MFSFLDINPSHHLCSYLVPFMFVTNIHLTFTLSMKIKYQVVRDRVAGHIFDSSPVDFTSDLGTRFIVHPSVLKASDPPRFVSWIANGIASGLDGLFLSRFESQRAEYWQTLYSSVVCIINFCKV